MALYKGGTLDQMKALCEKNQGFGIKYSYDEKERMAIFYGRKKLFPALTLASVRSTNGSRGQTLFRASFFNDFGVTPPAWPDAAPSRSPT